MDVTGSHRVAAAWCRAVRRRWRALAGGASLPDAQRATLVAVSGGADSVALALALGTLRRTRVVLAYVAHDLRPAELVRDDVDAVDRLARRLGRALVIEHVGVPAGNAEAGARAVRYEALALLADRVECPFIATGHHAGDQLETVLLALLRGGSPSALAGIRPARPAGFGSARLVRPMLERRPDEARAACAAFGAPWRCDATNADPARARSAIRGAVRALLDENPQAGESMERAVESIRALLQRDEAHARTFASSRSSSDASDTL